MIHPRYAKLKHAENRLVARKNRIDRAYYDGVFDRYVDPVLTADHVPVEWRYDLDRETNPHFIERLGVNAVFNAGAIAFDGAYWLMARVEGKDRKSFFALAKSLDPVSGFRFVGRPVLWEDRYPEETNVYDVRLVRHADGWIYGIYCAERKDPAAPAGDTSAAIARAGLFRTRNMVDFERLPDLETPSPQQRNVVLHPEFVHGKYLLYTRPQDGFIETGAGGGIAFGFVDDMTRPVVAEEKILDAKRYHTVYELKNGAGPAPIKTERGWIHVAHGVRNTAAGLRYVLYAFATALDDPTRVVAKPSGYLLAPRGAERVGDVSNVLFANGAIVDGTDVYLYYASSDTRLHVAGTTIARLADYVFENPSERFRSLDCAHQRADLADHNEKILEGAKKK
ncbi:MAG: glycosidase [Candidatus Izemoplasmatales bacterium]